MRRPDDICAPLWRRRPFVVGSAAESTTQTSGDLAGDPLADPTLRLGPVRVSIRASMESLNPSEAKVAAFFLETRYTVMDHSVTDVADAVGVAASTVVRACQRLGFRGFQDLKLGLAGDRAQTTTRWSADVAEGDSAGEVLAKVLSGGQDALQNAVATVNAGDFSRAVDVVANARQLLFAGVGTSAPLAQDAAYRFMSIGLDAEAPADVHVQHVRARLLTPADACVAISHTGATRETLSVVEAARAAGAHTIAITSFVRSPLIQFADIALVAHSRELTYRIEAMASRIAHLSILDALLLAVSMVDLPRSDEAQAATADVLAQHRF